MSATAQELAISLDLTPRIVAAFEDGSLAIPGKTAAEMTWRVATIDRREALSSSGLPECRWIDDWKAEPKPSDTRAQNKRIVALSKHVSTCPICQAREKFVEDRFGPMPKRPVTGWLGAMVAIGKQVDRLPPWMRPGVRVALFFIAYSAFRLLLMAPRLQHTPNAWLAVTEGFGASAAIGFAVGSLYGLFKLARARISARTAAS